MAEGVTDRASNTLALPVIPLSTGVALPQMVITITAESPEARAAVKAASDSNGQLLLVPRTADGRYARIGTVASIEDKGTLPGGRDLLVVRALDRAIVGQGVVGDFRSSDTNALWVQAKLVEEPDIPSERAVEAAKELKAAFEALFETIGSDRLVDVLREVDDPGGLADLAGWWPDLSFDQRLELLETVEVTARVELVLGWVREALAEAELTQRIRKDVSEGIDKQQREFMLRQQMQAIRKELGEDGDEEELVDEFRKKLAELREAKALADTAADAIEREIKRFERTPAQNVEHGWIRDWLDTVFKVPWGERSTDSLDIAGAREVLDADHTGLAEPKDRIVEYLAVRKLRADRDLDDDATQAAETAGRRPGAIVALVGPPGVGKTSLGASIARAMGRKFVRVALGGVRDEAEIRGHRRTYVGAQAGRVVRAIQEAGTMNPVVLLDEVDKVASDWRGDPSSALLEVLDPAQNHTFRDHYLEVDLDLSDVVFIATANVIDTIPGPLLDRMEIINLDGYTDDEKVAIARDHLLSRQLAYTGLRADEVTVTDAALGEVVDGYTREAGVRGLERQLGKLLRKVATQVATETDTAEPPAARVIDIDDVPSLLGRRRFHNESAERTTTPGVATGLAVTSVGGDVLFVEATSMPGESGLTVTGKLGDVMKESAQIALSYVRSRADELEVDPKSFEKQRFHVHFPAGAVPKDGPSAGITMTTALVGLLTGKSVRPEVGMTGEVTLQGRVLPIGGVKQKVLAAHRAGLSEVILPQHNEADLEDVPESVRETMTFHPVSNVSDVLQLALSPTPTAAEVSTAA